MQRTLDFYFSGRKRDRDVSVKEEDILECYEDAKLQDAVEKVVEDMVEQCQIDEMERQMEWLYFMSGQEEKDFKEYISRDWPRYLTGEEALERSWKVQRIESDFRLLPNTVDPMDPKTKSWYWDLDEYVKLQKAAGKMGQNEVPNADELLIKLGKKK